MTTMKPETHEVLTGICSCCLGRFVVEGDKPVLHGYKRPGDGAIRGECVSIKCSFPAYEKSTEGCVFMRDNFLSAARAARNRAGQLRAGQISKVDRSYIKRAYGKREEVWIILTPSSTQEEFRLCGHLNWRGVVEAEIYRCERKEQHDLAEAQTYQKYIDAWKPGLEFVSEARLDAEKLEVRELKAAAARKKRNFKAVKAIFFHVGSAISKHRKGWLHAEWEWEQMYIKHNSKTSDRYASVEHLAPFAEMYPQYAKKGKK